MPISDPFVSRLVAMLSPLGPVEPRAMFGGHGLYLDGCHIAIVHRGRVYFRVDAETVGDFVGGGGRPFRYRRLGKPVVMAGYREPPADSLTGETLRPWAERAVAAARRGARRARSRAQRAAP